MPRSRRSSKRTGENMRPTTLRFALVLAFQLASSRTGAIAGGTVMVVGKVSPRDRDIIIDSIKAAGTTLSWRFSAPAFPRDAVDASVACLNDKTPWSCLSSTIRGNEQMVIVEVDSDHAAGAPLIILTAHVLASGIESESTASRYCELC